MRLASRSIYDGCTTPFVVRWLISAAYAGCQQQRKLRHEDKHDLINDGINVAGGIAIEALVGCTRMPEYASAIAAALRWVGAYGSAPVRAAALYKLGRQLHLQTRPVLYAILCELVGNDGRQLRPASDALAYMNEADWLTVRSLLAAALEASEAHEALAGILTRAWLLGWAGAEALLRRLWLSSPAGREKTIRFLSHVYQSFDDSSFRQTARVAFLALLPFQEQELAQAYESFFHTLTAAEFGDWFPALQRYVSSPAGRGRGRQFYDYLSECIGRYPAECVQLIAQFRTHERPNIRDNGLEQRPLEILLSAYHVLTEQNADALELETALNVFDTLLQLPEYRTGVLDRLVALDRY